MCALNAKLQREPEHLLYLKSLKTVLILPSPKIKLLLPDHKWAEETVSLQELSEVQRQLTIPGEKEIDR